MSGDGPTLLTSHPWTLPWAGVYMLAATTGHGIWPLIVIHLAARYNLKVSLVAISLPHLNLATGSPRLILTPET